MYDKVKNFLIGIDFALLVFLLLAGKSLIFTISYPEALAFGVSCAIYGFKSYLKLKTPDPIQLNEEVRQELDSLKAAVNALKLEKNLAPKQVKFF